MITESKKSLTGRAGLLVVCLIVAVTGAALLQVLLRQSETEAGRSAIPTTSIKPTAVVDTPEPIVASERSEIETSAPEELATTELPAAFPATGVAIDTDGHRVIGLQVGSTADQERDTIAVTDSTGSFSITVPRAVSQIVSIDPDWATLRAAPFRARDDQPLVLVVAPRGRWSGLVVDAETNVPLPRTVVTLAPPIGVETDRWTATSDAMGRFVMDPAPVVAGARLTFEARGYLPTVIEPNAGDLGAILLVPATPPRVVGSVRLPTGGPAGGARVSLGSASTTALQDGTFSLLVPVPAPGAALTAEHGDTAPAVQRGVGDELLAAGANAEDLRVELTLGLGGASIVGRVVDADGKPLKHWRIVAYAGGLDGEPAAPFMKTRREGTFRIEGLPEGRYALRATGPRKDQVILLPEVVAPSSGVELHFAEAPEKRTINGIVRTGDGLPAPGVMVGVDWNAPSGGAHLGPAAITGEDGRFSLTGVPRVWVQVTAFVKGRRAQITIAPHDDREQSLQPPAGRVFTFEASPRAESTPDSLYAVDASGAVVPLAIVDQWSFGLDVVPLRAGRSPQLAAPTSATTLVLCCDGREVARTALSIDADGLHRWDG